MKVSLRGIVNVKNFIVEIERREYSFLNKLNLGFNINCSSKGFVFAAVDVFASFPLYYTIVDGVPYVSENVEDLCLYLNALTFDPLGFYCTTGLGRTLRVENTPIKEIKRLKPGSFLEFYQGKMRIQSYWNFHQLKTNTFTGSFEQASETLGELIYESVKEILDFDPKCAAHLSGGMDSGSICALMAVMSDAERDVYYIQHGSQREGDGKTEHAFVKKYKQNYSNLNLHTIDISKKNRGDSKSLNSISNWFGISPDNKHRAIVKDVSQKGIETIVTGLGGDEFASVFYSKRMKNIRDNSFISKSPRLNKYFSNFKIEMSSIWTGLKEHRSLSELYLIHQMQKEFKGKRIMYSDYFNSIVDYHQTMPLLSLSRAALSRKLKIDQINKQLFTIRSDKWNYLGSSELVDFLHPLLHKKIVSFCLSLPLKIYQNHEPRDMFKSALGKYIGGDFLKGEKRPSSRSITQCDWNAILAQLDRNEENLKTLKTMKNERYFNFSGLLNMNKALQAGTLRREPSNFYLLGLFNSLCIQTVFGIKYFNEYFT